MSAILGDKSRNCSQVVVRIFSECEEKFLRIRLNGFELFDREIANCSENVLNILAVWLFFGKAPKAFHRNYEKDFYEEILTRKISMRNSNVN